MTDNEKRAHDIALRILDLPDYTISCISQEANGNAGGGPPAVSSVIRQYLYIYQNALDALNCNATK